ncbi:hypothetical protein [Streptomyces sp. NPDC002599]|uniref:hypothetical protein n=1 Tax=Streptomyces sp. NPDC002599 TaxID=3154421 RepID=UPI00331B844E
MITMQNFGLAWTDPDKVHHASIVSYDVPSAQRRKQELEDAHCTNVEIVPIKPGQFLEPPV